MLLFGVYIAVDEVLCELWVQGGRWGRTEEGNSHQESCQWFTDGHGGGLVALRQVSEDHACLAPYPPVCGMDESEYVVRHIGVRQRSCIIVFGLRSRRKILQNRDPRRP
ncbi:hypothetical protein FB451DRAFT_1178067 [Mycena latifolia]|nr:hypothetical protein FB451DRAFT_1178067 [Mycena latifolia]